ncbi:hypothetical protein [Pontimicrobium sp. MEBiC06410]
MIKYFFQLVLIALLLIGCKTSKQSNEKKLLTYTLSKDDYLPDDYLKKLKSSSKIDTNSVLSSTTDFYRIKIISKPNKKKYSLAEPKLISLKITNYGSKELYLPEWFKTHNLDNNPEMIIEIYKKKGKKFKKYVQKRIKTETFFQPKINQNRVVLNSKKGKHISYDNIRIDTFHKIVDEGVYNVKIYIDLSNFGYFKTLKTEMFFEVIN